MRQTLGEFELQLLFALVALRDRAHGVSIAELLERETGRARSSGAIHTALDRLQQRGFASSWLGDPTPMRGGRRKRFYRLTPAGARALRASYERIARVARGRLGRLAEIAEAAGE